MREGSTNIGDDDDDEKIEKEQHRREIERKKMRVLATDICCGGCDAGMGWRRSQKDKKILDSKDDHEKYGQPRHKASRERWSNKYVEGDGEISERENIAFGYRREEKHSDGKELPMISIEVIELRGNPLAHEKLPEDTLRQFFTQDLELFHHDAVTVPLFTDGKRGL